MLVNAVTHSYAWLLFALVGICSQKKNKGLQLIGKLIAKALERLKTNKQTTPLTCSENTNPYHEELACE